MTDGERDALVEAVATLERIQRIAEAVATLERIQRIVEANLSQLRAEAPDVGQDAPTQVFRVGQSVRIRRDTAWGTGNQLDGIRDKRTVGAILSGVSDINAYEVGFNNDTFLLHQSELEPVPPDAGAEALAQAFRVGQSVRIRSSAGSVLSGRTGTITKGYMDGTFCVKVDGDIMDWHLSAHELERLPALSAEALLAVGMRVKVKHTGSLFYGVTGVIVSELDGAPHGWHVEFEGGSASYIDADLERLPAPVSELDSYKARIDALEAALKPFGGAWSAYLKFRRDCAEEHGGVDPDPVSFDEFLRDYAALDEHHYTAAFAALASEVNHDATEIDAIRARAERRREIGTEYDMDTLLAALEGLTGEGRWRTYQVDDGEEYCVYCGEPFPIGVGEHAADCPVLLAAAIVRRWKGDGA